MKTSLVALQGLVQRCVPGVLVATLVGMAAAFLGDHYKGSTLLFALLLGMALNFLTEDARLKPGIVFAGSTVLRIGVALLGLRLTTSHVASLGLGTVLGLAGAVLATVVAGVLGARWLKQDRDLGLLIGGATAICGASAALAIASILPQRAGQEQRTSLAVIGVTTLSTIAMVLYPIVTQALGFDALTSGIFIGATIHDVAQVVGAGFSLSPTAGEAATITKLIRVAFLVPVLLSIALIVRGSAASQSRTPLLPWFAITFAGLMLLNSTGLVPAVIQQGAGTASQCCLVVAIAAVGLKTSLRDMAALGWRPIILLIAVTVFLATLVCAGLQLRAVSP